MTQVQVDLKTTSAKVGKRNIDKARPYHDALFQARKVRVQAEGRRQRRGGGARQQWQILLAAGAAVVLTLRPTRPIGALPVAPGCAVL